MIGAFQAVAASFANATRSASRYHLCLPQRQQLTKHGAEFVAFNVLIVEEFAEDVSGLEPHRKVAHEVDARPRLPIGKRFLILKL